jgi:hypothetical protein
MLRWSPKIFLVQCKLPFFGQSCSLPFSLKKPWYPCPFEILAEALICIPRSDNLTHQNSIRSNSWLQGPKHKKCYWSPEPPEGTLKLPGVCPPLATYCLYIHFWAVTLIALMVDFFFRERWSYSGIVPFVDLLQSDSWLGHQGPKPKTQSMLLLLS